MDETRVLPQTGFPPIDSYTVHARRGELVARWRVDPARLCDALLPHPPHTLGTRNRSAGVQGNAKKCRTRTRKAKEKSKSSGTRDRKGPQERAPIWLHGRSEKCITAREQHIFSHTIFYHVPLARWQQKTLQRPGRPVRNSFYTFLFLIY